MTIKDIKAEARRKLALNMHQAIVVYTVEFAIFITLIALIVMSCVSFGVNSLASIVMTIYGVLLGIIAIVGIGMVNFAMTDFYLATYRCMPYNIRRLGETLARSNITKILLLSLKRTLLGILLTLCLIVPGVIYFMRTSMANNLLIANPKMRASTALTASNKVMSGRTGIYFSLCMSMLGWYILGILTLGIGFIFISPYVRLVKTVYYKRALQGDKQEYFVMPQPISPVPQQPQQALQPQQQPQPIQGQGGQAQADPTGPAPIDSLGYDDFNNMNAAMQDFGEGSQGRDDVPEVAIGAMPEKKKHKEKKEKVKEDKKNKSKGGTGVTYERKIDGTGLVESERVLSAEEITSSNARQQQILHDMYNNIRPDSPKVNYFDANRPSQNNAEGFEDDFGVVPLDAEPEPIAGMEPLEAQPIVEPVAQPYVEPIAQPYVEPVAEFGQPMGGGEQFVQPQQDDFSEPVMSDSEFDEFLKNFDSAAPEAPAQEPVAAFAQAPEPTPQPTPTPTPQPTPSDRRAEAAARMAARRETTGGSTTRDRASLEARRAALNQQGASSLAERAERIRREREQRQNQNNNGGR